MRASPETLAPVRSKIVGIPPHSEEAERGVISSILYRTVEHLDPAVTMLEAQARIVSGYFFNPLNRTIWEVLVEMFDKKKPLNFIALTQELRDRNLLDGVGGAAYVTELSDFVPTSANIEYYLDVLRDKFALRQVIAASAEATRRAYEEQDNVPALLDEVQEKMTAIALNKLGNSPIRHIEPAVEAVIEELKNAHKHRGRT
jgi:replicative DNA helicase